MDVDEAQPPKRLTRSPGRPATNQFTIASSDSAAEEATEPVPKKAKKSGTKSTRKSKARNTAVEADEEAEGEPAASSSRARARRDVVDQAGEVGIRATRPMIGGPSTLPTSRRGAQPARKR